MIPCVRVKPGCQFTVIAPGGFAILGALSAAADYLGHDIVITSACDGNHSGPSDPHHLGRAYDIRTHDLPGDAKRLLLSYLQTHLGSEYFYVFLEDADSPNEHIHAQVAHGTQYPPESINAA